MDARSRNHFCRGRAKRITYSKCVFVALVIQQAKRMGRIMLSSMTSLTLPHYFTLLNKR
jgi:hypothetical protein